jgi:hypothetical protein
LSDVGEIGHKRLGKNTRYGMKDAALSAFRESIDFIYWFKN